jgi:glycosyltransferase involved in cell wall biosynthesis
MRKRFVFISNMASPHQVKFCYGLQEYLDTEFWFHMHLESNRPAWWKIDLGEKCKVLGRVLFRRSRKYLSLDIVKELRRFNPDVVMLGGFFILSNIVAYRWARKHGKKVMLFTEISRSKRNVVRKPGLYTKTVRVVYANIDAVLTSSVEATHQFRDDFGFGDKVHTSQYATDLEAYLNHPLRKPASAYVYLFANRLVDIYNPLVALEAFAEIRNRYPGSKLLLNSSGPLLQECKATIASHGLEKDVEFLEGIQAWNDMHRVYLRSDILLLPALFSAGNFSIIEGMASGLGMVVSNRILGSGKYIEHGKNGFVCEPTTEGVVNGIESYVKDPGLLRCHGEINKEIAKKYSVHETARLFDDLISERVLRRNN